MRPSAGPAGLDTPKTDLRIADRWTYFYPLRDFIIPSFVRLVRHFRFLAFFCVGLALSLTTKSHFRLEKITFFAKIDGRAQEGQNEPNLALSWAQVGPKLAPSWLQVGQSYPKLAVGPSWPRALHSCLLFEASESSTIAISPRRESKCH